MDAEEFESHLSVFSQKPAWQLSEREPAVAEAELNSFEDLQGYKLPFEYRYVAARHGCGQVGFAAIFSVRTGGFSIEAERALAHGLPDVFVPISDNGCGDYYGFVADRGICAPTLYFADHELGYAYRQTEFKDMFEYLVRVGFAAA